MRPGVAGAANAVRLGKPGGLFRVFAAGDRNVSPVHRLQPPMYMNILQ